MTVEFGPKPLPLPPIAQSPGSAASSRPAPLPAAPTSPAVVLGLSGSPRPAPPGAAPPPAATALPLPAPIGGARPALLQQAHLNLGLAEKQVLQPQVLQPQARAAPGRAPSLPALPPQEAAAALVQAAALQLAEGLRALPGPEGEERRSLAILRTFLGQAQDPDGLPAELLLPATLREVRQHLEALLRRAGLPALDPSHPGLRRSPQGDWAWVAELGGAAGGATRGRLLWMGLAALVLAAALLLWAAGRA